MLRDLTDVEMSDFATEIAIRNTALGHSHDNDLSRLAKDISYLAAMVGQLARQVETRPLDGVPPERPGGTPATS